jgi:hypothetical protein
MVDAKEFVETVTKMVYKECRKRRMKIDEDLVQDVLVKAWSCMKRLYNREKGARWTTYIWWVIDSVLKDKMWERNKELRNVSLEEMLENGEDWRFASGGESFHTKLLRLLESYGSLVGEDFFRLVVGSIDTSNALRSVSISKDKGEVWIEGWLGRKMTEAERRCCQEIIGILD